ncbi:MAG TPA: EAL domain-containing response regulator [Rhodanobacter sp.]|jgi:EAL domain-containing protein (putative c-di-GMP-specific phosphodiesterase class I)/ActR/RegA family two-component response regulator|nr:EAL domain-containing response regulator [Rhodanobacter sp.]
MADLQLMVVDDDHFTLRLISEHLTLQGYIHVESVAHAGEALERMQREGRVPDIVLCDLNMPEMDGIQFIESIGRTAWDGSLILLTGAGSRLLDAATQLARSLGIYVLGALGKPLDPTQLREMLESYEPRSYPELGCAASSISYAPADLADAIEQDQLILHYQPLVSLADGMPSSIECLVRWRHPHDGLVYPEQFITLAEEHDLIDSLTERVIRLAATQTRAWRETGLFMRVAINLSMDTLQRPDVVDWLMGLLDEKGLTSHDVVWEVTESRFMQSRPRTLGNLTRLGLKDCRLAIDDFGIGHSSLAQLRDLPFDELKIDRSFVHKGADDPVRRAIVVASADMARALNMHCIAEGVETADDWTFARNSGCTHAQGWAIARPMPAICIPPWLERWPPEFTALQERS